MIKRQKINWKDFIKNSIIMFQFAGIVILASFLRITQVSLHTYLAQTPAISSVSIEDQRKNLITLTNQERLNIGLTPLSENPKLTASAQKKACDMKDRNYYDHYAPDYTAPWDFFQKEGYNYRYAGENIARGHYPDAQLVADWMASEDHKTNILNSHYVDTGVGVCGYYIVQHFGQL